MIDPRVMALCAEFGWTIVPKHVVPGPGQTRAPQSILKVLERGGIDDARLVMQTLSETANNKASLEREVIGAAHDLLRRNRKRYEADPEKWFRVWDLCPVGELQAVAHELRGFAPSRGALAGMIYERIWRAYGPRSIQPDLLDDRRMTE